MEKEYFAFISYQRQDEDWAKWIAYELEHYHLPTTLNGRADLPENLRPIFRDMDELSAGNLPQQIHNALQSAKNLIVICSPHAVQSPWVNKEILEFIQTGRVEHIFPFIVDGHPYSQDPEQECFPEAIRALTGQEERLGANVNENGRDAAVVKLVAGMLGLAFDTLWQRYEREKAEEERKIKEQRDNLLRVQSQFVSEKAVTLVEQGNSLLAKKLLLEVLPKDLSNPDRPYTPEAERALRYAYTKDTAIFKFDHQLDASLSPDGKRIIATSRFTTMYVLYVLDVETGQELQKLDCDTNSVNSAFFSPDGKYIISSLYGGIIQLWGVETGQELKKLEGHTNSVNSAVCSPDGKRIVSASDDQTIRIWDVETGQQLQIIEGHSSFVQSASFSPDGKCVVSASWDNTARVWDAQTGRELQKLEGDGYSAHSVSFSPDGKRIVFASLDNSIRIYDAETGQELQKLVGHTNRVRSVSFSPDGRCIVSASDDQTIRIWDVKTGIEWEKLQGHTDVVNSAFFSPDGKRIVSASSDQTIRIWGCDVEPHITIFKNCTWDEKSVYTSFSCDGKLIVCACNKDHTIRIYDVKTGQELQKLEGHTEGIQLAFFSPDGKRIVSASRDNTMRLWAVETGNELYKFDLTCTVTSASFSPDGKRIVSALFDGTIQLWDVETGHELLKMERNGDLVDVDWVDSISFSPDGKRIVSGSTAGTVQLWDVETGKELQKMVGHTAAVRSISFTHDGKRIVSASFDHTVRIWDAETGQQLKILEGHVNQNATLSPDGKYVASASQDETVRIWDIDTGRQVFQCTFCHLDRYRYIAIAFSPDGRHIITAEDDCIKFWSFPPLQELIDQTRELFKDCPLTPEERKKYYLD